MWNASLLDNNAPSTCERTTIRKKIISRLKETKKLFVLTLSYVPSNLAWHAHTSHRDYYPPS